MSAGEEADPDSDAVCLRGEALPFVWYGLKCVITFLLCGYLCVYFRCVTTPFFIFTFELVKS